jgi:rhodanese-related sulfurtransferase
MDHIRIRVDEVRHLLEKHQPLVFVDSRNPRAWAEATERLPGALRVAAENVQETLDALPRGKPLVVYCT